MTIAKLHNLWKLAEILEQASLASTQKLRKKQQEIENEISELSNFCDVSDGDMDYSRLVRRDKWFVWQQGRLATLGADMQALTEKLEEASVVARRNMGRRQAMEEVLRGLHLENKRLLACRATEFEPF